jgi:hypothetical protein
MNKILKHYRLWRDKLLTSMKTLEDDRETSDLNNLVRSLRGLRGLFEITGKLNKEWCPDSTLHDTLMDLLNTAHYVNDMTVQQKAMQENEELMGMDLAYLLDYTQELAGKGEEQLRKKVTQMDRSKLEDYEQHLSNQTESSGEEWIDKQLMDLTHQKVKKAYHKLKETSGKKSLTSLRYQLMDTCSCLEVADSPEHAAELREAGIFLDIWHDRQVSLEVIKRYKKDYPEMVKKYTGTLEILEDYLKQKVDIS